MAITTECTTNLRSNLKPSGHTPPATTIELTSPISEPFEFTIAASGVTHASSQTTGLTALVAAVKSYADGTWIPNVLKLDATETIEGIITITSVQRKNSTFDPEAFTGPNIYVTGVDQFLVRGTFEYE